MTPLGPRARHAVRAGRAACPPTSSAISSRSWRRWDETHFVSAKSDVLSGFASTVAVIPDVESSAYFAGRTFFGSGATAVGAVLVANAEGHLIGSRQSREVRHHRP